MIYELKHFDKTILRFSAVDNSSEPDIKIIWTENDKTLLPLDLELTDEGLYKWLKHRTIPSNRAFVRTFLSKCGLSLNRPLSIIKVSKGLSLNDCYWIVEENFDGTFEKYNLYDNPLSRILAQIAFVVGEQILHQLAVVLEQVLVGLAVALQVVPALERGAVLEVVPLAAQLGPAAVLLLDALDVILAFVGAGEQRGHTLGVFVQLLADGLIDVVRQDHISLLGGGVIIVPLLVVLAEAVVRLQLFHGGGAVIDAVHVAVQLALVLAQDPALYGHALLVGALHEYLGEAAFVFGVHGVLLDGRGRAEQRLGPTCSGRRRAGRRRPRGAGRRGDRRACPGRLRPAP